MILLLLPHAAECLLGAAALAQVPSDAMDGDGRPALYHRVDADVERNAAPVLADRLDFATPAERSRLADSGRFQ